MLEYSKEKLLILEQQLLEKYHQLQSENLQLDLTRGKPSGAQLELSNALDGILAGDYFSDDGTDTRNYGGLDGISEMRQFGADLLEVRRSEVMVSGNSSLTLMYLYLMIATFFGVRGEKSAWNREESKFICVVPGYDRHFSICEELNIQMISVPMKNDGPDMDMVENLVKNDPTIKGMWCVPKYSNPTGNTYSENVVDRIAKLPKVSAPDFRIMWDNAYIVHDFGEPQPLANIMDKAREYGTLDSMIVTASTSKITFAGAGISFLATSPENLALFKRRLSMMTIGPNKVNQLRHYKLLPDLNALRNHMQKHAKIIKPKFDLVLDSLKQGIDPSIASWTTPQGGYFISFDTLAGVATKVVALSKNAGVKLTPAGATWPYQKDPKDTNIRIAPTLPSLAELKKSMEVFVVCVNLATVQQRLTTENH